MLDSADHSTNVSAFSTLGKIYNSDSPDKFHSSVKLESKDLFLLGQRAFDKQPPQQEKFVFPEFAFEHEKINVSCPGGYINWGSLHQIYDFDKQLKGNLRKAPKLAYSASSLKRKTICSLGNGLL